MNRFLSATFNASGSWVAPAGVTTIIVMGAGGGSGGYAGAAGTAGAGGAGTNGGTSNVLQPVVLTVVPNTSYTVTIGAGGAGGSGTNLAAGTAGGDTSFGALMTWVGAPVATYHASYVMVCGVINLVGSRTGTNMVSQPGCGGGQGCDANTSTNTAGYCGTFGNSAARGTNTPAATTGGCGGSGATGIGIGGTGGAGSVTAVAGVAGGDAAANSAGGGGGGGGGGSSSAARGNGGAGGSGQLVIMWVE